MPNARIEARPAETDFEGMWGAITQMKPRRPSTRALADVVFPELQLRVHFRVSCLDFVLRDSHGMLTERGVGIAMQDGRVIHGASHTRAHLKVPKNNIITETVWGFPD